MDVIKAATAFVSVNSLAGFLGGTKSFTVESKVDPFFTIDPTFPFADEFTIRYSPDMEAAAVPEPATSLLCCIAAIFLGLHAVHRKMNVRV
jgi:hypothetical protein